MEGLIEYKCRRCGGVESGTHTPDVLTTMVELLVHGRAVSFPGVPCTTSTMHSCPDGGTGWADVIGGRKDMERGTVARGTGCGACLGEGFVPGSGGRACPGCTP